MTANDYLSAVLFKHGPKSVDAYQLQLALLRQQLRTWAGGCFVEIVSSGSRAKGTAIGLASDIDYLVSLTSDCNARAGGLEGIFDSLAEHLTRLYPNARIQNVSVRLNLDGLEVDVTPARKQPGLGTDHWLFVSKTRSRKQTNIHQHIRDVSRSGRISEIKLLKIWRERHQLELPSIYLEYLTIEHLLRGKSLSADRLSENLLHALSELARDQGNPLFARMVDPANSTNILSDLLTLREKQTIIDAAKSACQQSAWSNIVW